ncbi:hypothetical protein FPV67DRAFT_108849 [Lyophyllum atratum]|nr:hypothetical protein FPV67DRAFT_108849 [Lyophyllum atratum]
MMGTWSPVKFALVIVTSFGSTVVAQTLTLTFVNGPTIVQVQTTNDKGFPAKTTIATLSGSTPPTSSPSSRTSDIPSSSETSRTGSAPNPTGSSAHPKAQGTPVGVIAGIIVAVVVLLALAFALFFIRRRKRRRRRGRVKVEIDPVGSPVVNKSFLPDPFITDTQARGMGYNASHQPTRRIEAKFLSTGQRASSEAQGDDYIYTPVSPSPSPAAPRIIVTRVGETIGRPVTPSSSGHHGPQSLTGHAPSTQYALDIKSAQGPGPTSPHGEGSSSATGAAAPSQTEMTRRMRDLLAQMEHQSDGGVAVVQLQRQVEMLQRENEELRLTGAEAPPAYEGDGRF